MDLSVDKLIPSLGSSTHFFLWIFMSFLCSTVVNAGMTSVWCDAEPRGNFNYKPACEYTEGEVAWMHADILIGPAFPKNPTDFLTGLIYTKEGCVADEGLDTGDPGVDCTQRAAAVQDYGPIVIEHDGQWRSIESSSSSGYLKFIPIELVDDCEVESSEVFSVYTRPEPFPLLGATSIPDTGAEVVINDNDDNFFIEFTHYDVVEEIGTPVTLTFNVKRRGVLADKTIEYSTTEMTATAGEDFVPVNEENIDFDENSESVPVEIQILSDALEEAEGPELFSIELFFREDSDSRVCTGKIVHPSKAYVTIHDPETTLFYIEQGEYSVIEPGSGVRDFTFNIKRKGNLDRISTLEYSIRDLDTTPNSDYDNPQSRTVTFATGSDEAPVTITIRSDASTEHPEFFEVSLDVPAEEGLVTNPSIATVIIQDYSVTRSCVEFETQVYSVLESESRVDLKIVRIGNAAEDIVVDLSTTDIDATSGDDYTIPSNFRVNLGPQQTEETVTFTIVDDQRKEENEVFQVSLVKSSSAVDNFDICSSEAEISIRDDDDQFYLEGTLFQIQEGDKMNLGILRCGFLGKESSVEIRVTSGSTISSDDYVVTGVPVDVTTSIPFAVTQDVYLLEITANDDNAFEEDEEFFIELVPESGLTISSDDQIGLPWKAKIIITSDDAAPAGSGLQNLIAPGATVKLVAGSLTIVERPPGNPLVFTNDLYDPTSTFYQTLKADIEKELSKILSNLPGFRYVTVMFFSPGSVVVTYEAAFDIGSTTNKANINAILQQSVNQAGVLSGSNLKLDPTEFSNNVGDSSAFDAGLIGIILGGVSGVLFLLMLLCVICFCVGTRKRKQSDQQKLVIQQEKPQPMQHANNTYQGTNDDAC